jgi:hypothetical protein
MGNPVRSWRRYDDTTELVVEAGTLQSGEAAALGIALERWGLLDEPTVDAAQQLTLRIPDALWTRLGVPPVDPEQLDDWREEHRLFAHLAGVSEQQIHLKSIGYLGGPTTRFEVSVAGRRLAAQPASPLALDTEGIPLPLLPAAWQVVRAALGTEPKDLASRAQQLAWLGTLRQRATLVAEALADGSVTLSEDEHLAKTVIQTPTNYALAWERRDEASKLLDLRMYVAGDPRPLDLFSLDAKEPILMDSAAEQVARVAQKNRGKLRERVGSALRNPAELIPEGVNLDHFDLESYSDRVLGFEPALPQTRAAITASGIPWFTEHEKGGFVSVDLRKPDGSHRRVDLATVEDARELRTKIRESLASADTDSDACPYVELNGDTVPATRGAVDVLDFAISQHDSLPRPGDPQDGLPKKRKGRMVVVLDEPAAAEDKPPLVDTGSVPWGTLEQLLKPGITLKEHQRHGVAWLWSHFTGGDPRGVLLADDMGLGKTLQVACLLALRRASTTHARAPSLVVAPVILLENWQDELEHFFLPSAFPRVLVLHGERLARFRRQDGSLDDVSIGQYDIVLTNYNTLQSYQRSLLRIDWAIVALDEAHNIKNPSAYCSRAARGLKREMAVAATGTPVENKLSNLWSLFDFASPGAPLPPDLEGFRRSYEAGGADGIKALRQRLRYPHESSKVLRRTKSELKGLPAKVTHIHHVSMTPEQVELEALIVKQKAQRGSLPVLHQLSTLYQHGALLHEDNADALTDQALDIDRAIATSPKLARCLDLLEEIRAKGEKALVFALRIRMQRLLASAIRARFGLPRPVAIINGAPENRQLAKRRIVDLGDTDGFGVLVLSPIAAGSGLNIQCANHVIHYGRWWNPAKEDQATDRAYRIGQERTVHVHHLLMHQPGDVTRGFDVNLHELVERKRAVATDFLSPHGDMQVSPDELGAAPMGEPGGS